MIVFSLALALAVAATAAATCYEPSFALPSPKYDVNHAVLRDVFKHIHDVLTIAIGAPEYNSTSFSVEVTSSDESLWSFHHTARARNASRPDIPRVTDDALYRIASITKVFTVLGILQQQAAGNVSLDEPIEKYIGELQGPQNGSIPWKDITLRSLASQLSGIPREIAQSDLINAGDVDHAALGLPPVSREGLITCDEYSKDYEKPCTADDLIRSVKADLPIFAPNQQSTYSNIAFELLGLAIAKVTNQTYESYIDDAIFKPLEMTKSTFSKPPDRAGVIPRIIPPWPQYWDVDEGIQNPTGGIYSSSSDLSKFLRYILTHYNGVTHALNWMHPVSPSQNLHSFYGMPWEIFQTDRVLSTSKRTIRYITKGGSLPGYSSLIILIPQYDLGIALLLAGPPDFFATLLETVSVELTRGAEELAISELQDNYAGRFIATDPKLNSSLVLVADHRGLVVEEFISNSTNILQSNLIRFFGRSTSRPWYMLLVPTLLYRDEENQKGETWRMHIVSERSEEERDVWDDACQTDIDAVLYGGVPLNEVVFWKSQHGMLYDVELVGFRASLTRIIAASHVAEQEMLEL